MDEIYRGYRIAVTLTDRWHSRVTHVRGHAISITAEATVLDGAQACLNRTKMALDQYLGFLSINSSGAFTTEPDE